MPRPRKTDTLLPKRVYRHGKKYRMRIYTKDGKPGWHVFKANSEAELFREHTKLVHGKRNLTMNDIFDRYARQEFPVKAAATQASDQKALKPLREAFGDLAPDSIAAPHIVDYVDRRRRKGPIRANREIALLSHVFTRCRHWGIREDNPAQKLHYRNPELPRDRYVTDEELRRAMELAPPVIRYVMRLAVLTGLRRADLLKLMDDNFTPEGLRVTLSKSKRRGAKPKTLLYTWSPALTTLVENVRKHRAQDLNGHGGFFSITVSRFERLWTDFQKRVVAAGIPGFQMKDLRAKFGTEREERYQDATAALAHSSSQTTKRHYQRKPQKVTL